MFSIKTSIVFFMAILAITVDGQFNNFPSFGNPNGFQPNNNQNNFGPPGVIPQGGVGLPNPNSGPSPQWALINAGFSPFQRPNQFGVGSGQGRK